VTPYQIGALCVFIAIVAWTYIPALSFRVPLFTRKPNALTQIQQVMAIKESSTSPKVQEACQALLQALIS
jgi:hypothetical protein